MRRCKTCGGAVEVLARTLTLQWVGCPHCQRTFSEPIEPAGEPPLPSPATGRPRSRVLRGYLVALAAALAAVAVRMALQSVLSGESPFLLFTPAVTIAALYGGVGPGVLATLLGAVLGSYFFLPGAGEHDIETWDREALFLLVGTLITALAATVSRSRRQLSQSLWREQKARAVAEAADRAKDDFLAMVSHELRTPASTLLGWASMIRQRRVTGPAMDRAVDAIERNARLQTRLIEDVLDRSRMLTGTLRLEREVLSINDVLQTVLDSAHGNPGAAQRTIEIVPAHGTPRVLADPVRLQQVFGNLLSNALKFTSDGGRVRMEATADHDVVRVAVTDDGAGIAPEFLPHVFDGFRQAPRTLRQSARGLGLGLSIARELVQRHGGSIEAASEGSGKGATFTVTLPLHASDVAAEKAARVG